MEKTQTVFIIHTSPVSLTHLNELFAELAGDVKVKNIIDDSLLAEVLENGGLTPGVLRRICIYAIEAESAGADLILNQCSSVGEAADIAASMVKIPLIKIDERMAEVACNMGGRIGVVATLKTTLGPTTRLVRKTAEKLKKKIEVLENICEGAFDKLISGDRKGHNEMVIGAINKLAEQVDVVVCAQGSMVALLPELGKPRVPVLTSPRLGVEHTVEVLSRLQKS